VRIYAWWSQTKLETIAIVSDAIGSNECAFSRHTLIPTTILRIVENSGHSNLLRFFLSNTALAPETYRPPFDLWMLLPKRLKVLRLNGGRYYFGANAVLLRKNRNKLLCP
jgi:hypothetical protein